MVTTGRLKKNHSAHQVDQLFSILHAKGLLKKDVQDLVQFLEAAYIAFKNPSAFEGV